ncbi:MAG: CPBP family glutamic-type intramembrane protease [Candidatus Kariarchaeaceae archaeon]|jgi:membrane protease YdiL (CAAX protease family)
MEVQLEYNHAIQEHETLAVSASKSTDLKAVGIYYLLTFVFTWFFWGGEALYHEGIIAPPSWFLSIVEGGNPAAWGPFLAAFLVAFLSEGRSGMMGLLRRAWNRKYSRKYGVFAIFSLPIVIGGAMAIGMVFGDHMPELPWYNNYLLLIVMPIVVLFIAGPLQEEFGWRGTVQTRLLPHFNKWLVGLFIGFTWALWHLPLFWIPGVFGYYNEPMWGTFLSTMALSVIMVWLYERTQISLLPMFLFHSMFNSSHVLFPVLGNDVASLWYMIGLIGLAVACVVHDTMTKKGDL